MSSIIDIHRNEIGLVNSYMRRLDVTTNVAITFAGIGVSVAFAGPSSAPFAIILATFFMSSLPSHGGQNRSRTQPA